VYLTTYPLISLYTHNGDGTLQNFMVTVLNRPLYYKMNLISFV